MCKHGLTGNSVHIRRDDNEVMQKLRVWTVSDFHRGDQRFINCNQEGLLPKPNHNLDLDMIFSQTK